MLPHSFGSQNKIGLRAGGDFDELPAGGDVLGVILVVFIVFVITDVIGATDIFPFIKPVK